MARYPIEIIKKVKYFRQQGKTYGEIRHLLGQQIPKSTLSEWGKGVFLPKNYQKRIDGLNLTNLGKGRQIAVEINKIKREELIKNIDEKNAPIAQRISDIDIAKIALAMLCLGEAAKYNPKNRTTFSLGNSDPRIILIFLNLMKYCFPFNIEKVRCTVQCRADQDIPALEDYWLKITNIPKRLFYKTRIDPRTVGKPTKKLGYKGVLKVDYFDRKVQLEIEALADLIYRQSLKLSFNN